MNKIKVLMIDDNVQLIEAVKEYFKSSKLIEIISSANDGLEGIKSIEKEIYDVIVLDLIMPKKDGLYVLDEMKKRNINKKVIVATSYNTQEVIREVSDYGVNYYILKPFDLSDLENRILAADCPIFQLFTIPLELPIAIYILLYLYTKDVVSNFYNMNPQLAFSFIFSFRFK